MEVHNGYHMFWRHHYHPDNFGCFKKNLGKYSVYAQKTLKDLKQD